MVRLKNILLSGSILLSLTMVSNVVLAQSVVFSASASASRVGVADQVQITYTIQDAQDLQTITPGSFGGFELVAGPFQSNSTNMYVSGNKMVQSNIVSLTYILQPTKTGTFTIPAATARDAQGHTYRSNTIQIQVVNGSLGRPQRQQQQQRRPQSRRDENDPWGDANVMMQQMQQRLAQLQQLQQQRMQQMQAMQQRYPDGAGRSGNLKENLFIRVTVDKNKVYVGEQVTATYKLYTRLSMDMHISKMPSLNGFWMEDIEKPGGNNDHTEEMYNGRPYQVFVLKKAALFPQQTGTLKLDAAEAEGTADYTNEPVHLTSNQLSIEVMPLPENGKPTSFTGAVGRFNISSRIDKLHITTDDMATLKLTISGAGNLKLITPPQLQLPDGLEPYDPIIADTITGRNGQLSGTKTISYAIGARAPGTYEIPAIPFSYFNAQTGNYVTVYTQPATIQVKPGKKRTGVPILVDIHSIKTEAPNTWKFGGKPLLFSPAYWSLYALPLLAFIGLAFWRGRQEDLLKDMVQFRSRTANKVAFKRLAIAQQFLKQQDNRAFYEETSKAIWLYVSDKLNIPLSTLSRERATAGMAQRSIGAALREEALQLIDECETALYSPSGGSQRMEQTYNNAAHVISKLEENFRS